MVKIINKKSILIFLLFILIISIFPKIIIGQTTKTLETSVNFIYFGNDNCLECVKTTKFLNKNVPSQNYTYKNNFKHKNELYKKYKEYNVPENKYNLVPVLFFDNSTYMVGFEEIEKHFMNTENGNSLKIEEIEEIIEKDKTIEDSFFENFTFIGIMLAGMLDGINPCSIAMLLFFLSLISFNKGDNRNIILISLSYILGIFITYLLIGLGLYKFVIFLNLTWLRHVIFIVTIILTVFLAFLNMSDYINIKKGKHNEIKAQLPIFLKHKIHNVLRKNDKQRFIILTTFISGILVSLLEFFCTGQIYLPTINYMIVTNTSAIKAFSYLIVYNLFFVLPLVIISCIVYFSKSIIDVSQVLVEKLHIIKLLTFLFFIIATIILTIQYIKII